jgi:hypothetical protein
MKTPVQRIGQKVLKIQYLNYFFEIPSSSLTKKQKCYFKVKYLNTIFNFGELHLVRLIIFNDSDKIK